jgi:hypothetical protein
LSQKNQRKPDRAKKRVQGDKLNRRPEGRVAFPKVRIRFRLNGRGQRSGSSLEELERRIDRLSRKVEQLERKVDNR